MTASIREALTQVGLATTIQAPEPVRTAPNTLPAETIGWPILEDMTWAQVVLATARKDVRVYFKRGKRDLIRVVKGFEVNDGKGVEVRFQGETEFHSFAAADCPRVVAVVDAPKNQPKAEKSGKAASDKRKRERAQRDAAYRSSVRGHNPAVDKGHGKSKRK